jgi:putative pyruvate formate lyase activating enzyme
MTGCTLCPRTCPVDRGREKGACGAGPGLLVGAIVIHRGEEPPLVTGAGSGAVFFSGCPLKCSFCQNKRISHEGAGTAVSVEELASAMLALQERGCSNINLVSPTHYAPSIISALGLARGRGLVLPAMLNSSGYERVEALQGWQGHAGIFLMDLKYGDNGTGGCLSRVPDYWDRAREAVTFLWEEYGELKLDSSGAAVSGLMVRHLVLPGMLSNPFAVLEFLAGLSLDIPVSIMSQYNPAFYGGEVPEMKRRLLKEEYEVVLDRACDLGFSTIFGQDLDSVGTYVPDFDAEHPFGDGERIL